MYWYADDNDVRDYNGGLMAKCVDFEDARYLVMVHNKAIRQLTQREVKEIGATPDGAIRLLESRCSPNKLGNEIHLQLGDDGYWYATTTVDTLNQ